MPLSLRNGEVFNVVKVGMGTSAKGYQWTRVECTQAKVKMKITLWVTNKDHGLTENDAGCTIRVDDFGMSSENKKDGIKIKFEQWPEGSGKWLTKVEASGVTAYKLADSFDSFEGDFTAEGNFTETDDGELPF